MLSVCVFALAQLAGSLSSLAFVTRCQCMGTEENNGHQEPKGNHPGRGNTGLSTNRFMFHPHRHFIGMLVRYCCRDCAFSALPFAVGR